MNSDAEKSDLRASPLRATDLEDVAPAIVITSGFDVLRDQGIAYAEKLKEAGVKVTYRCYDRLAHGFTAMTGAVPAAKRACEEIARDLHSALRG
jgi:acetyl esterase/lipase